jgi:Uncharacterised nucleotidyltransferase
MAPIVVTANHKSELDLWKGVDRLVDRAPGISDLRAHRVHLLAARHWRAEGRLVPPELVDDEIRSATMRAIARAVLRLIRDACDGQVMVLKGPHTATAYPAPHLRPFNDLDILAEDPDAAQRALIAAGFTPAGFPDDYYKGLHHLRPLISPGPSPLAVEIHRWPNWFGWADPPPRSELFAAGVPDVLEVPGIPGLAPAHHALVLTAHSWVELPLRRLLDLVDIAAVSASADRRELERLAERWQMRRVWQTTVSAIDSLFYGDTEPASLRVWARDLSTGRDRTVLETHVRRWLSAFWALPPGAALPQSLRALTEAVLPAPSDSWHTKLARSRLAVENMNQPASEHAELLGRDGRRAPRFRRR